MEDTLLVRDRVLVNKLADKPDEIHDANGERQDGRRLGARPEQRVEPLARHDGLVDALLQIDLGLLLGLELLVAGADVRGLGQEVRAG